MQRVAGTLDVDFDSDRDIRSVARLFGIRSCLFLGNVGRRVDRAWLTAPRTQTPVPGIVLSVDACRLHRRFRLDPELHALSPPEGVVAQYCHRLAWLAAVPLL